MTRRRPPDCDYVCQRCGCPCGPVPGKHLGGGSRNMKACKGPSMPRLRSELEAEAKAIAAMVRERRR